MKIYVVGGAVRNLLLGQQAVDKDYLVYGASKEEFMRTFPLAREVGKDFPVFLLYGNEFAFPRADTIEEDLALRDLTINAVALDDRGELSCHPNSMQDLNNKILRQCSDQSFYDDPLRVFRAARFQARFPDFLPHPDLLRLMSEIGKKGILDKVPKDRIGQETMKSLRCPRPGNFIRLLSETGCISPWFKELAGADKIPAGPKQFHRASLLEHTAQVMDTLAGNSLDVWMGLCHDLGKTATPKEALPSHHGHDKAGIPLAEELGQRIRMPNQYIAAGKTASALHMKAAKYDSLRPGTRVDLLMELHSRGLLENMMRLIKADGSDDFSSKARQETKTILEVKLPNNLKDMGEESGKRLRMLRAQSLA